MPGALANSDESSSYTDHDFSPSSWLPLFRPHTPRTRFITLPAAFISSELSGAVYIADPSTQYAPSHATPVQTEIEWSDGSVDTITAAPMPSDTHGIHSAIEDVIATLDGAVCPKFGTKCPIDATWATFQRSTKCTTPDDVLTLLKSSERVMSDMKADEPTVLALRQWADIDDKTEFRVFVRSNIIVGICPRLAESIVEDTQDEIDVTVQRISTWYDDVIRDRFNGPSSHVIDVYRDGRDRVWIIDFAPWGPRTDSLLFTWEQLEEAAWMPTQGRAQFRSAYRHAAIRPSPRMYDGLPVELRNRDALLSLAEAAQRLAREQNDGEEDVGVL